MDRWEQLIAAREHLHLSQAEAAKRLNVGLETYQHWELGKRRPQPKRMRALCELFDIQPVFSRQDNQPGEHVVRAHREASSIRRPGSFSRDLLVQKEIREVPALLTTHLTAYLWSLALRKHATCGEKQAAIRRAIQECDRMYTNDRNYQIARRKTMGTLATLPLVTLGLALPGKEIATTRYGKALAQCTVSLEACWDLFERGGASELLLGFQCVSRYLAALRGICQSSTRYQEEALRLAACYALLKTFFGWECAGAPATIQYAREAVSLSKESADFSLQLSAYSKLAWSYTFARHDRPALAAAQEALAVLEQAEQQSGERAVPASIRGGTYSTLAMAQARNGLSSDIALAKAMEHDPGTEVYAYQDFTRSTMLLEAGWTYCYQGNHAKTIEVLEQRLDLETFAPRIPQSEVGRVRTMNILALSSLKAKDRDLERTIHFWIAAVEGARALQSNICFSTAFTTYEHMSIIWPGEARVRELRDHLVHWEEVDDTSST